MKVLLTVLLTKAPQAVYPDLMAKSDLPTEDTRTLEEIAKEYYSVRRSEFTLTDEQTEIIVQNAQGRFTKLSAAAIETIAYLLEHADSDAVRWNVAKFVVEHNLFKQSKEADAIEQLLKDLYKDKVPSTSATE